MDLYSDDGQVLDILEYHYGYHPVDPARAYCVIATASGTFTDWYYIDELDIEVAA